MSIPDPATTFCAREREAPAPPSGVAGAVTPAVAAAPPAASCAAFPPDADPLDGLVPGAVLTAAQAAAIEQLRARAEPAWAVRARRLRQRDALLRDLASMMPAAGSTLTARAIARELARVAALTRAADRPDDAVRATARRVLALQPDGLEWRQVHRIIAEPAAPVVTKTRGDDNGPASG